MDLKQWSRRGSRTNRDDEADIESKLADLFDNQTLFERLPSEPVWRKRLSEKAKKSRQAVLNGINKTPMAVKLIIIGGVAINTGLIYWQLGGGNGGKNGSPEINQVAGVSTSQGSSSNSSSQEGVSTTKPSIKTVTPSGAEQSSGVERKAPSGDVLYTFKSKIGEINIEVTEQTLPEHFKTDQDTKLKDFADGNYLSLFTQIDQMKVYGGINEKSGVQTLLFIKSDLLIFIKADKEVDSDLLIGYILNLK